MTSKANHDSSAGVKVKEEDEEEETLGQLRDRQVLATARAAVPGPRAPFVHIKVEDSTSGEDIDGEGSEVDGGEATDREGEGKYEVEEEDEEEDEEEAEPQIQRAHAPGASLQGGSQAVRPWRFPPGACSEPGAPRARLRAPGRLADNAVQDDDAQQQHEKEAGFNPDLVMRGGGDRAGSSRFQGVHWNTSTNKWRAQSKGKHLGYHTSEEVAARAYTKYLKDGVVP